MCAHQALSVRDPIGIVDDYVADAAGIDGKTKTTAGRDVMYRRPRVGTN